MNLNLGLDAQYKLVKAIARAIVSILMFCAQAIQLRQDEYVTDV